ncbi:putative P-loop containing dynein motor region D4 [Blattamonas nauphoetae]|uniref:P-loop containing dynein motor region D4 n=1 Tax=Blattamonas nauphoetae TaxID=2049346 RepID=A0ABQ9YKM6_9EUKA|nr:putative P-loop containing dynein motor region D4 [Blattamonas nauphoetae]
MRERHWEKLKEETQSFDQKSAEFTLEKVFEIGLNEHLVSPYKQVARVGSAEDIKQQIDDHLMDMRRQKAKEAREFNNINNEHVLPTAQIAGIVQRCVDISKLQWVKWEDTFPNANWKPAADTPFHRIFVPTVDTARLKTISGCLVDTKINETDSIQMPLVLFEDATRHVCRFSRTISLPLGHTMFVCVGGSGRESFARLGVFVSNYGVFTIEITRNFHLPQFRDCLKDLYRKTGLRDSTREEAQIRGISATPDLLSNLFIQHPFETEEKALFS